jgi:hypothetical protein
MEGQLLRLLGILDEILRWRYLTLKKHWFVYYESDSQNAP